MGLADSGIMPPMKYQEIVGAGFLFYDSRRKQKSGRRRGRAFLVPDRIHRAAHCNNLSLVIDRMRLKQDNTKIGRTCVVQVHHSALFGPNKRAISDMLVELPTTSPKLLIAKARLESPPDSTQVLAYRSFDSTEMRASHAGLSSSPPRHRYY